MKKYKVQYNAQKKIQKTLLCAVLPLCITASLFFAACKTPPVAETHIDPFTLFDEGAGMYLRIPVKGNESFLQNLVRAWTDEVSDSDLQDIFGRTSTVYAAFFVEQGKGLMNKVSFQIVLRGNYPLFFLNAALTHKKGWADISAKDGDTLFKRKKSSYGFELAYPDSGTVFVSNKDVLSMQKKYALYRLLGSPEPDWPLLGTEKVPVRSFIQDDEKAGLYMPQAGVLLPKMVGSALELAIDYAAGTVKPYKDDYVIVHLKLQMRDERALKIAEKLFRFAVLGTNIIVKPEAGNILVLDNFAVSPALLAGFRPKK
ncbi:hypothetical protein V1L52_04485 [Treponema sp. HNW]|uniref:lipoprotein n=1 Tax=Treponema sp. HNW TaxID=3116654 RepID=UPI003D1039CD